MTSTFTNRIESNFPRFSAIEKLSLDLSPYSPLKKSRIKWGSVTRTLPNCPRYWDELSSKVRLLPLDPSPHDVMIGRIVKLGRHSGIEQNSGLKAKLFLNDLVGVAFGNRYATAQFEGDVPPRQHVYHMLSQGGVVGRVVSAANHMQEPTLIQPLGYLVGKNGEVVNLKKSCDKRSLPHVRRVPTIVVVGSSMDSGKTHTMTSIAHGLTLEGLTVNAGKLTGTACAKDPNRMRDAGAARVLDFNDFGFASTFRISRHELHSLTRTMIGHLSADSPDYLLLEIADGVVQQETRMLLSFLVQQNLVDHICVAVHDALSAPTILRDLRETWEIEPTLLSGAVTRSPLSTAEADALVDIPCVPAEILAEAGVSRFFQQPAVIPLDDHNQSLVPQESDSEITVIV